jgi:hypothetical protein
VASAALAPARHHLIPGEARCGQNLFDNPSSNQGFPKSGGRCDRPGDGLGMEVGYFTRRGNTTWQTVDVGDAGINLSVCWLPGLEPLFPICRQLAQKRRIHCTSINGKS